MQRGFTVAWRNLRRNRRRNAATIAAIALGYAGLVVLGGYASRLDRLLRANTVYLQHTGHVMVYLAGGFHKAGAEPERFQLDPAAQEKIVAWAKHDARVEFTGRYLRGVGLAGNGCGTFPTMVLGVEQEALAAVLHHPEVTAWSPQLAEAASGRWFDAYPALPNAAAVSAGLAITLQKPRVYPETEGLPPAPRVLDCDTGARAEELARDADVQLVSLTYDGVLNAIDTEMTATFHASEVLAEEGSLVTRLAAVQQLFATDRVTYIALFLRDARTTPAVMADLTGAMRGQGLAIEAIAFNDERASPLYVGTMTFLGAMVGFITTLVVVVLGLTVLGAMTLTVLERSRELGTWRALGFHRGHLVGLVVREALLLALLGLAIGLLTGLSAAAVINHSGLRLSPPGIPGTLPLLITPALWACAVLAVCVVPGVCLAAFMVARAQAKRSVVDLLTAQTG